MFTNFPFHWGFKNRQHLRAGEISKLTGGGQLNGLGLKRMNKPMSHTEHLGSLNGRILT